MPSGSEFSGLWLAGVLPQLVAPLVVEAALDEQAAANRLLNASWMVS